ncbi:class I SAM-dependent methyltransferase [Microbacterium sp.]|uniref:class I SAM-dependent methyltransferase n=1 Tax=Microbacterium sp. TaxID=51671 RepID=UPI003A8573DF
MSEERRAGQPPDALTERIRERFEAWDAMHRYYFPDYDVRWERTISLIAARLATLRPLPHHGGLPNDGRMARILDLGCGPGTLTRRLAAALPPACRVIGVDADPLLIGLARAAQGTARFECATAGANTLGSRFAGEGAFDIIVSSAFVHYFDSAGLLVLLRECRSLLAPGGALITVERFAADAPTTTDVGAARDEHDVSAWARWWAQTRAAPDLAPLHQSSPPVTTGEEDEDEPPPPTELVFVRSLATAGFAIHGTERTPGGSTIITALRET